MSVPTDPSLSTMPDDALVAWYVDLTRAIAERRSLRALRVVKESQLHELDNLPDVDLLWLATEASAVIEFRRAALQAQLEALQAKLAALQAAKLTALQAEMTPAAL